MYQKRQGFALVFKYFHGIYYHCTVYFLFQIGCPWIYPGQPFLHEFNEYPVLRVAFIVTEEPVDFSFLRRFEMLTHTTFTSTSVSYPHIFWVNAFFCVTVFNSWALPRPALAGCRKACIAAFYNSRVIRVTPSRAFAA